jgi:undecaprenyl-diphosphatase
MDCLKAACDQAKLGFGISSFAAWQSIPCASFATRYPMHVSRKSLWTLPLRGIEWIGGHPLGVQIGLLVVALSIWGFVAIADEVMEGETLKFDDWVIESLRQADNPKRPIGPRWLAEMARDVTALGGVACLSLLVAAVAGFLLLRQMYGAMALVLGATLGGLLVSSLLKWCFNRPRPDVVPHLDMVYTSSFPSGHSMLSAIVFLTLGALLGSFVKQRRLKAYFLLVAIGLTTLVGLSRVFLGVHYPTDVLAGWCAGLAWAAACWVTTRILQRKGAVEDELGG